MRPAREFEKFQPRKRAFLAEQGILSKEDLEKARANGFQIEENYKEWEQKNSVPVPQKTGKYRLRLYSPVEKIECIDDFWYFADEGSWKSILNYYPAGADYKKRGPKVDKYAWMVKEILADVTPEAHPEEVEFDNYAALYGAIFRQLFQDFLQQEDHAYFLYWKNIEEKGKPNREAIDACHGLAGRYWKEIENLNLTGIFEKYIGATIRNRMIYDKEFRRQQAICGNKLKKESVSGTLQNLTRDTSKAKGADSDGESGRWSNRDIFCRQA